MQIDGRDMKLCLLVLFLTLASSQTVDFSELSLAIPVALISR